MQKYNKNARRGIVSLQLRIYESDPVSSSTFCEEDSFSLHVEEEPTSLSICDALDLAQSSAFSFFVFP